MKVIFLDIDGVLNNNRLVREGGMYTINSDMIAILKKIVDVVDADIVLSSTWRIEEDNRKRVRAALAEHGLDYIDCTIDLNNVDRSWSKRVKRVEEIKEWLGRHPEVTDFAIIDDDPGAGEGLNKNFFQTSFEVGLDEEVAMWVIEHFTKVPIEPSVPEELTEDFEKLRELRKEKQDYIRELDFG